MFKSPWEWLFRGFEPVTIVEPPTPKAEPPVIMTAEQARQYGYDLYAKRVKDSEKRIKSLLGAVERQIKQVAESGGTEVSCWIPLGPDWDAGVLVYNEINRRLVDLGYSVQASPSWAIDDQLRTRNGSVSVSISWASRP